MQVVDASTSIPSADGVLASFPSSLGLLTTHLHTYSGSGLLGSLQAFGMGWQQLVFREAPA